MRVVLRLRHSDTLRRDATGLSSQIHSGGQFAHRVADIGQGTGSFDAAGQDPWQTVREQHVRGKARFGFAKLSRCADTRMAVQRHHDSIRAGPIRRKKCKECLTIFRMQL
jgi:hypothetical protein